MDFMDQVKYFLFNPKDPRLKINVEVYDGIVLILNFETHCLSLLGAPPAYVLAWLPFSWTLVMGHPARGGPGLNSVGCSPDKPGDAVDQFVAREANGYKAQGFSIDREFLYQ